MNLEALRLLRDNSRPLQVTLEETENEILLTRDGTTVSDQRSADALTDLKRALAHHPQEVWINGERLETTPWTGLGRVTLTEPGSPMSHRGIDPGEKTPGPPINAYVGGVATQINTGLRLGKRTTDIYFTPREETGREHHHHTPLSTVQVQAFLEIEAGELDEIKARGTILQIPENSPLEERIIVRAEAMIQRTMKRREMPPRYSGEIYGRPTRGEQGEEHCEEPYAIGVEGKPVVIVQDDDDGEMENSVFITIVENLYREDSELVPVMEQEVITGRAVIPPAGPEAQRTRSVAFDIEDHPSHPAWAERITMKIELEDGTRSAHDCSFHLCGTAEWGAEMKIVPRRVERQEITDLLTRAYWTRQENQNRDEFRQNREEYEERMDILAEHLVGNTIRAVREELQRMLDQLHPSIPIPEEKITVTSWNGKLQLTLNP